MAARTRRLALVCNSSWAMVNFRMALMRALRDSGWEVLVVAPDDGGRAAIEAEGLRFEPWAVEGRGTNPLAEARSILALLRLFRRARPTIAFCYTIKPALYGSLVAPFARARVVAVVTGLGFVFLEEGRRIRLIRSLYRFALRFAEDVWFLNEDDRRLFRDEGLVRPQVGFVLPGEGVDIERFSPRPPRPEDGRTVFLMLSRLVYDKGVGEYFEAAAALKGRRPDLVFQIAGALDEASPAGIPRAEVDRLAAAGTIEYLGKAADVRPLIAAADFVVLSSYREGLSRALLEAASMGKPIVATDVPGCREVVEEGVNGFLAPPRDAAALALALERAAASDRAEAMALGARGRARATSLYSEGRIVEIYESRLAKGSYRDSERI